MPIPIIKIEISANAVAWYGAIVATLSVIVSTIYSIYLILKDKRKLRIKVSEAVIIPWKDDEVKLLIQAINNGDKQITLTSVGLTLNNKKHLMIFPEPGTWQLPFALDSGKNFQAWVEKKKVMADLKKSKNKIKFAWFRDATGKIFRTNYHLEFK